MCEPALEFPELSSLCGSSGMGGYWDSVGAGQEGAELPSRQTSKLTWELSSLRGFELPSSCHLQQ